MTEDRRSLFRPPPPPPRRPRPLVTNLLVAANVVVYLFQMSWWGLESSVARFGQDQIAIWDGELWRLLTAPFLHGGFGHLAMNCLGLFLLGEIVEWRLGKRRLLAVYGLAGIAGGLVFQAFPASVGVGASGAVYGLAGALLVLRFGHVARGRFRLRPSFFVVGITLSICDWLFALLLEKSAGIHVAITAHLGGLVCGAVLGYIFQHPEYPVPPARRWGLGVVGSACLVAFFIYGCFYPVLNPVWTVWRQIQLAAAEGAVEKADVQRLIAQIEGPEVFHWFERLVGNLMESGKEIEARGRVAEKRKDDQEAAEHFARARRRYGEAVRVWNFLENRTVVELLLKRSVGYQLFDDLMGMGVDSLAKEVLAELIATARLELGEEVPADAEIPWGDRADSLNNLAWFLALEGKNLREALECARAAVEIVRRRPRGGFLPFIDHQRRLLESAYVNTLGWVQFLIGEETDLALKNLREAAELAPLGPNFLYLGMAYASLGDERAAIDALRSAEVAGGLSPREQRLFREVKAEMGL